MKLPNGFGTVYKQPGNRRNPYVAKKTKGWEINPETGKAKQLYTIVGYYPTRKEALTALSEFNANWIVNTFSDNFFKVILPVLYRGLISQRGMYPVMVIPVHIIP